MKRYVLALATLAVIVGGLLAIAPQVNAASVFNVKDTGDITLAKDDVHNGAYYAAGQDITIDGTINGDLYCAGQAVRINGTVTGDVLCAAQKITINGTVGQDVRSAAQTVMVTGQVGGTLTAFAQDVDVAKGATVAKDLNGAAQAVTIDGTVKRDVAFASQKITVSGLVEGSAALNVESLSLTSRPAIASGIEYTSTQKQSFDDKAVSGPVTFHLSEASRADTDQDSAIIAKIALVIVTMLVVSSLVLALFMPRTFERSYAIARQKVGIVGLVGFATSLGLPIVAVLLFMSVFGLPLGLLALSGLGLLWLLAFPFAAYYIARALFGKVVHNVLLLMLSGSVLLGILLLVPFLNIIAFLFMIVVGIGGVVVTVTNGYQKPRYSTVVDTPKVKRS